MRLKAYFSKIETSEWMGRDTHRVTGQPNMDIPPVYIIDFVSRPEFGYKNRNETVAVYVTSRNLLETTNIENLVIAGDEK